jgi:hypothetical protein
MSNDIQHRSFWENIEVKINGTPINGITEVKYNPDGSKTVRDGLTWRDVADLSNLNDNFGNFKT